MKRTISSSDLLAFGGAPPGAAPAMAPVVAAPLAGRWRPHDVRWAGRTHPVVPRARSPPSLSLATRTAEAARWRQNVSLSLVCASSLPSRASNTRHASFSTVSAVLRSPTSVCAWLSSCARFAVWMLSAQTAAAQAGVQTRTPADSPRQLGVLQRQRHVRQHIDAVRVLLAVQQAPQLQHSALAQQRLARVARRTLQHRQVHVLVERLRVVQTQRSLRHRHRLPLVAHRIRHAHLLVHSRQIRLAHLLVLGLGWLRISARSIACNARKVVHDLRGKQRIASSHLWVHQPVHLLVKLTPSSSSSSPDRDRRG